MSFALPESLRTYIDERVRSGTYGNTSEYLRDLIRRDQEAQAQKRLRELITEGLGSGPGRPLDDHAVAELRDLVEGFPVHWYYFIADDHLDVVRLLADARDLPTTLTTDDDP